MSADAPIHADDLRVPPPVQPILAHFDHRGKESFEQAQRQLALKRNITTDPTLFAEAALESVVAAARLFEFYNRPFAPQSAGEEVEHYSSILGSIRWVISKSGQPLADQLIQGVMMSGLSTAEDRRRMLLLCAGILFAEHFQDANGKALTEWMSEVNEWKRTSHGPWQINEGKLDAYRDVGIGSREVFRELLATNDYAKHVVFVIHFLKKSSGYPQRPDLLLSEWNTNLGRAKKAAVEEFLNLVRSALIADTAGRIAQVELDRRAIARITGSNKEIDALLNDVLSIADNIAVALLRDWPEIDNVDGILDAQSAAALQAISRVVVLTDRLQSDQAQFDHLAQSMLGSIPQIIETQKEVAQRTIAPAIQSFINSAAAADDEKKFLQRFAQEIAGLDLTHSQTVLTQPAERKAISSFIESLGRIWFQNDKDVPMYVGGGLQGILWVLRVEEQLRELNQTASSAKPADAVDTAQSDAFIASFLKYQDAPLSEEMLAWHRENNSTRETARKYVSAMLSLGQQGVEKSMELARVLRAECLRELRSAGIGYTPYAQSITWALWDICKQLYLLDHPQESDTRRYRLANPLHDEQIREEIISRHLGWEFYTFMRYRATPEEKKAMYDLLHNLGDYFEINKVLILLSTPPNEHESLSSSDLVTLGRMVRYALEAKNENSRASVA